MQHREARRVPERGVAAVGARDAALGEVEDGGVDPELDGAEGEGDAGEHVSCASFNVHRVRKVGKGNRG